MNLKERGVTVGDLFLIILFIIAAVFVINKVNDDENKSQLFMNPYEIIKINIA